VGIFEVIRITNQMAGLIQTRTPVAELRRGATQEGMKLLRDSALDKVREGTTSLEEALSITISEDDH
jgi:type IV pilus assembly protein PilB